VRQTKRPRSRSKSRPRCLARPAGERSPAVLAHEVARAQRMADVFECRMADLLMQGAPNMAQLILAVFARKRSFGDLTAGSLPAGCDPCPNSLQCERQPHRDADENLDVCDWHKATLRRRLSRALAGSSARTDVMTDDLSDLEIAVLCDLLENPGANLKAHKRAVLDQLVAKKLVEPAKDDPTKFQLSDEARHVLALRGVGVSGG